MFLIGENLNVINMVIGKAFKEKDPGPIAEEGAGALCPAQVNRTAVGFDIFVAGEGGSRIGAYVPVEEQVPVRIARENVLLPVVIQIEHLRTRA